MTLDSVVSAAIRKSGLTRAAWARRHSFAAATLHDALRKNRVSGKTLARLQRAGVVVARRRLIDSLA